MPQVARCRLSNLPPIDFVWTGDDWEYRSLEDLPGEFTLMDKNGNRDPLRRHEVHYAEKTLGVCISMDGNEDAEMTRLKVLSKTFADQIRIAPRMRLSIRTTHLL